MATCEPGKTGKKAGIEPMPIRAYSVAEFCRIFRVSRPSVYKLFASGELHSVVRCRRPPVSFITPASWKRAVGLPPGVDKDRSRSMAIARWPSHAEDFKRVKDDGTADAALIGVTGLMRAGKLQ